MDGQAGWFTAYLLFSLDCIRTDRKCVIHMSKFLVFPHQNMLLLQILPGGIDK